MIKEINTLLEELQPDTLKEKAKQLEDMLEREKLEALKLIEELSNIDESKEIQNKYFGKKGFVTKIMKYMGNMSNEDKPQIGKKIHENKEEIEKTQKYKVESLES